MRRIRLPRPRLVLSLASVLALGALAAHAGACRDGGGNEAPPAEADIPFVTDAQGRVLVLHGVNVLSAFKSDPAGMPGFTRDDARRIARDWGMNFVRFLIFWSAVEPRPGEYDEAYLASVAERLDWLAAEGVHVMLDMHQDVYASRFCCDGAPEWAIRDEGEPFTMRAQWFANYFEPAVKRSFDNFWTYPGPHADLQDHYAAAWAHVAARLGGHAAVLGYDIMNEPHPGSDADLLELIGEQPGADSPSPRFDREKLTPFYQRVIERIRTVDETRWIFYESRYGAPGNGFPSYLGPLHDPRPGPPRLVFSPHLYSLRLESTRSYDPERDFAVPNFERLRGEEARAQGAGIVLGEWGAEYDVHNVRRHMRDVVEMCDRLLAGWAYWSLDRGGFGFLDGEGRERDTVADLVRVYPRRIAGVPAAFFYDAETRAFRLEYDDAAHARGPTEISVPAARFYPDGFDLTCDAPAGTWSYTWDAERELALVTIAATGTRHVIEIRPKR